MLYVIVMFLLSIRGFEDNNDYGNFPDASFMLI